MSLTAEQLCKPIRVYRAADGHEHPDVTRITYKFFHFMQITRG